MGTALIASDTSHACTKQAGFRWNVSSLLLESIVDCAVQSPNLQRFLPLHQMRQVTLCMLRNTDTVPNLVVFACVASLTSNLSLHHMSFDPISMIKELFTLSAETLHVLMSFDMHVPFIGFTKGQKPAFTIMCLSS